MNVGSVYDHLHLRRPTGRRATSDILEAEQVLRLQPVVKLPPGFEDILEVQVLGYREELAFVGGRRRHVLEPIWTLVPKDG